MAANHRKPWFRTCLHTLIPLLLGLPGSAPLEAQVVEGRVLSADDGRPLIGAFVRLFDEGGTQLAAVLSDTAGAYRLRAPGAGVYRVRAQFIGRETVEMGLVRLEDGDRFTWSPGLSARPIRLGGIAVEGTRRCEVRPEEGSLAARMWTEARKALEVASWALSRELFRYALVERRREMDPDRQRVVEEEQETHAGFYRAPFVSRPAAELVRNGFVQTRDDGTFAHAPDADVLLSDAFLDTHCFRAQPADGTGRIGLAFEPTSDRRVPDIRGVMWLDVQTAELRSVSYTYTRFPGIAPALQLGGHVDFERLRSGAWIVRRWGLEMPVLADVERADAPGVLDRRVVGIMEKSGEVLRVVDARGTVLLSAEQASLTGAVYDSIRGVPLEGAVVRLAGTSHRTSTLPDGTFLLAELRSGRYSLRVEHARLDSLGIDIPPRPVDLVSGATTRVQIGIPTVRAVGPDLDPVVEGEVLDAATGRPLAGALVSLVDANGAAAGRALTDLRGAYRIRAPAAGEYRVHAEVVGRTPSESARFRIEAATRVYHSLEFDGRRMDILEGAADPGTSCIVAPEPAAATGRAWTEARRALSSLILAQEQAQWRYRITLYQRERPQPGILGEPREEISDVPGEVGHRFDPVPIRDDGVARFVEISDSTLAAVPPSPRFLVSAFFARRYCLRLLPGRAGPGTIALGFEPMVSDRNTDVRGLLVLDSTTHELRSLHYRYVDFPIDVPEHAPGGWIAFERLPGGAFFLGAWEQRLPVLARVQDDALKRVTAASSNADVSRRAAGVSSAIAFILHQGGYVREVESPGGDRLWQRASPTDDRTVAAMWRLGAGLEARGRN